MSQRGERLSDGARNGFGLRASAKTRGLECPAFTLVPGARIEPLYKSMAYLRMRNSVGSWEITDELGIDPQ